jgi:hypothetical protein
MTTLDEPQTAGSGQYERNRGAELDVAVTAHRSSPGRAVFTEAGNTDAWIATDLTVDVTR